MACSFLSVVCLGASLSAQSWHVDSTKIGGARQDSAGRVWGFGLHPSLGIYRWEGEKWLPFSLTGISSEIWPWTLASGPDGAVYFLWSDGAGNLAVSRHQGLNSKLVVRFGGRLRDRPRIFVDPGRNVWITEQGRHIFRVTPEGKAECLYTISDSQFLEVGRPQNEHWAFNPIYATADGRGRVWFWSNSLAGRADWASLAGVLVFDGVSFEHHPHLAGIPDKKLSVIVPADAEHLWLPVVDDQLYRIDINSLTAVPAVPEPSRTAFANVQSIVQTARETYVVAGLTNDPVPERSGGGRFGVLWQGTGGTWKRLVNGLDMRPESLQQPARPFLATDQGLWIGAFGNGPWLMPARRGAKELIDWHYGYPFDGSEGLFQLADGRLLVLSANQGTAAVKPADLSFQSPSGFSTLNPLRAMARDAQGHFWGILAAGDDALSEWDGRRWIEHPLPQGFPAQRAWDAVMDSLGRVWLPFRHADGLGDPTPVVAWTNPENFVSGSTTEGVNVFGTGFGTSPAVQLSEPGISCKQTFGSDTQATCTLSLLPDLPGGRFGFTVTSHGYNGIPFDDGLSGIGVSIFEPERSSFDTFLTYDRALEAQIPRRNDLRLPSSFFKAPSYASDGRICYRETRSRMRYFDGGHWHEWSAQDIAGLPNLEFLEPPFFDRAGNPAVQLTGQTWEFVNPQGWRTIPAEPNPAAERTSEVLHFNPAPPGCDAISVESLAQDRLGTLWFTSHGQLYRAIGAQCVRQFAADEHQPFVDGRKLQAVLTDPLGSSFLLTQVAVYYDEYVELNAQPPLPKCALLASVEASGNVAVRFTAKSEGASGFTWKVDGGPWNTPAKTPEITLEELPNGRHRIEAAAVDQRLQMDLTPAATIVDIHIDVPAHIRGLIQKLTDPDYSVREKAVAALVRRAPLALPLLQSAREQAGPDQRWWIDAATQKIKEEISTHQRP